MTAPVNVKLRVDARDAVNALKQTNDASKQLNQTLGKTEKKAATATGNIQRMGVSFRTTVGAAVALTGAVTFLGRSLGVLGERQANVAALTNGLKKLGRGEQDLQRLKNAADELGKATLFDQEQFTQGFALLTSFQSIGVESFERVAEAAADVATLTGQDVNSSLLQLAKALQDPVRGLTALSRSGTQFTDQQKEQIKALVESGKELEAQNFILEEIEKQYANAARAAGSAGYSGAVDSLGESFRDFQERLATGVEPAVIGATKALSDLFDIFAKIPTPVGQAALGIGATATAIIALKAAAVAALPAVKALFAFLVANPFVALAAGITAATVALAGYRNESERIADAAVGGGAAEIQAARAKLIETEQEISLKKLELKDATGKKAQQIRRELKRLRDDAEALRRSVPRAQDPKADDGTGGGGGGGTDPVKDMSQRMLDLNNQLRAAQEGEQQRLAATLKLMVEKQKISESNLGPVAKENALQQAIHNFRQEIFRIDKEIADQRAKNIEEAAEGFEAQMAHQDELRQAIAEQKSQYEELNTTFRNGIVDSILDAVEGTKSLSESLAGVLKQMARMILQQQLMNALSGFNIFGGGGGGGGFGVVPKTSGMKFFANGGSPPVGRPSVVGERGPELFVPKTAGTIIPNNAMGGSTSIVVNVDASGSSVEGDADQAGQLGKMLGAAVQAELIKQKRPGGLLAT